MRQEYKVRRPFRQLELELLYKAELGPKGMGRQL